MMKFIHLFLYFKMYLIVLISGVCNVKETLYYGTRVVETCTIQIQCVIHAQPSTSE